MTKTCQKPATKDPATSGEKFLTAKIVEPTKLEPKVAKGPITKKPKVYGYGH